MNLNSLKIALIYDKVNTPFGGAEHGLAALHQAFPNAPLFTSIYEPVHAEWARDFAVMSSFLNKMPFFRSKHQILLPLMPLAFESFNLDDYDVIISVTAGEAKGVLTKPHQLHICYLLTPPRYLYTHQEEYLQSYRFAKLPIFRQIAKLWLRYLKWWDEAAGFRPDFIIPISGLVKARAEKIYGRAIEEPLYPPVPSMPDNNTTLPVEGCLLSASRLVPYKRLDLSIAACKKLGLTLVVTGDGAARPSLLKAAGRVGISRIPGEPLGDFLVRAAANHKTILFANKCTENELAALFRTCRALLMPGVEDFGITAMQAAAVGLPVIMAKKSGAAELLHNNKQAFFLNTVSEKALIEAIKQLPHTRPPYRKQPKSDVFTTQFAKKVYDLFISHQDLIAKGT